MTHCSSYDQNNLKPKLGLSMNIQFVEFNFRKKTFILITACHLLETLLLQIHNKTK
jgi:hypothetical protein